MEKGTKCAHFFEEGGKVTSLKKSCYRPLRTLTTALLQIIPDSLFEWKNSKRASTSQFETVGSITMGFYDKSFSQEVMTRHTVLCSASFQIQF